MLAPCHHPYIYPAMVISQNLANNFTLDSIPAEMDAMMSVYNHQPIYPYLRSTQQVSPVTNHDRCCVPEARIRNFVVQGNNT